MPDQQLVVETSTADLMDGKSLWVVLYPDTRREGQPEVESYHLRHILMKDESFWGTFGSVHYSEALKQLAILGGDDPGKINPSIPSAYAYSNQYQVVCMFSYIMSVMRFSDVRAYRKIKLIHKNDYELIWSSDTAGPIDSLHECVENGRQLKLLLTDETGASKIHPVHTPEIYPDEKKVRFFTAYDAYPKALLDKKALTTISDNLVIDRNEGYADDGNASYLSTPLMYNTQFDSTMFLVDVFADGTISTTQWEIYKKGLNNWPGKTVHVFAEI